MKGFGSKNPRMMPMHLFRGAHSLHYDTAIRGNTEKQNYSVCPRYWYLDADFNCDRCGHEFTWTAEEQKTWFEDYFFWIDSYPRHCRKCRASRRHLESLRNEYDAIVSNARAGGTLNLKQRVIEIVCELESAFGCMPEKMIETKELFTCQIEKAQQAAASGGDQLPN